jgi:AcrR family transcriptional regulator
MGRPRLSDRAPLDIEALTQIALRLFNEKGYEATTMADIAAAAGIKAPSIYFHVQGKEQLLDHGVTRALDALFAVLAEPATLVGTASDRLRYLVERSIEIEVKHLPEVTSLVRLRGNTDVELRAMERRRTFDATMAKLVRAAQAEGTVRRDIDPTVLTRLLLGMEVSLTEWYRRDGKLGWREIADAILAVAFEGIATGPRPREE